MTPEALSTPQLVEKLLQAASRPLTLDEIIARIEALQPMQSRNPRGRVRSAISNLMRASTLGAYLIALSERYWRRTYVVDSLLSRRS